MRIELEFISERYTVWSERRQGESIVQGIKQSSKSRKLFSEFPKSNIREEARMLYKGVRLEGGSFGEQEMM